MPSRDIEVRRAQYRAWYAKNGRKPKPVWQARANNCNQRARMFGVGGKVHAKQIEARFAMFAGCWRCGAEKDEVDHVIPLGKGGLNVAANIRPACVYCNRSNHNNI